MRFKSYLSCLVLVIVLVVALPASVVTANGEEAVSIDMLAAAGIRSGDTFTIYYNDDGSILEIIKGTPNGVLVDSQFDDRIPQQTKSYTEYDVKRQILSGQYDRGTVSYTTTHIYYYGYISRDCEVAFGAYNVTYNYFTGLIRGAYDETTGISVDWYGSSDTWKYEVYNMGPDTCINDVTAGIYY